MNQTPIVIAVLDDEPRMRKALRRLLTTHGFRVEDFGTGADYLATVGSHAADCLVLDLHMPDINGFDVLTALANRQIRTPVVIITGHDAPGTVERVRALGASAYLTKPVDETALLDAIEGALAAPGKGNLP